MFACITKTTFPIRCCTIERSDINERMIIKKFRKKCTWFRKCILTFINLRYIACAFYIYARYIYVVCIGTRADREGRWGWLLGFSVRARSPCRKHVSLGCSYNLRVYVRNQPLIKSYRKSLSMTDYILTYCCKSAKI